MRLTTSVILIAALAALGGCGEPTPVTDDAEAVLEEDREDAREPEHVLHERPTPAAPEGGGGERGAAGAVLGVVGREGA